MSTESQNAEKEWDRTYRRHPLEVRLRALADERARLQSRLDTVQREMREVQYKLAHIS